MKIKTIEKQIKPIIENKSVNRKLRRQERRNRTTD